MGAPRTFFQAVRFIFSWFPFFSKEHVSEEESLKRSVVIPLLIALVLSISVFAVTTTPALAVAQQNYTVSGVVTSSVTGSPVANAEVGVWDPDTELSYTGLTDASGSYSFSAPQDTNYIFFVRPPLNSGLAQYQEKNFALSSDTTKNVALPQGYVVSGTVTRSDTGAAVEGAQVGLWDPINEIAYTGPPTDANGSYTVTVPSGVYDFQVNPPAGSGLAIYYEPGLPVSSDLTKNVVLLTGFVVSGQVTQTGGSPVAGARFTLWDPINSRGYGTETDTNGNFSFIAPASTYELYVEPPQGSNLAAYAESNFVVSGDTTKNVTLSSGYTVSGTVSDPNGNPVQGAIVVLWDPISGAGYGRPTDASGQYSLTVPAGTYEFHVEPPPGSNLAIYHEMNVAINADTTKNVTLTSGYTVSGVVSDSNGNPVQGAFVFLWDPINQAGYGGPPTNSQGQYSLSVPAGTYELHVDPPAGLNLAHYSESGLNVAGNVTNHNITLSSGYTVSGIIYDPNNNPVQGAEVRLWDPTNQVGYGCPPTGPNGAYSMTVPGGTYEFHVDPPPGQGLASYFEDNFQVTGDVNKDVTLSAGYTVSGDVTDSNGDPVSGVFVGLFDPDTGSFYGNPTDVNGHYSVTAPPDNNYTFFAEPPQILRLVSYSETGLNLQSDIPDKDVTLASGVLLYGTVTDKTTHQAIAGARISVSTSGGPTYSSKLTDANGEYSFVVPPNSNYTLYASPPANTSYAFQYEEGVDVSNDPTQKNVELSTGYTVSGTVKDTSNNPIAGVHVTFSPTQGFGYSTINPSDAQGNYSLRVPAGTNYLLWATPPPGSDFVAYSESNVSVTGDIPTKNITLTKTWLVTLNFTIPGYSDVAKFGVSENAANNEGFDQGLDEVEPSAPQQGISAYLYHSGNPANYQKLSTSYLQAQYPRTWTLKVEVKGVSGNVTISWNPGEVSRIPSQYAVSLTADGNVVNMRSQNSYTFSAQADQTYTFTITVQQAP